MGKSQNIKFQDEIYRDDRIFVMNLSKGKVEINTCFSYCYFIPAKERQIGNESVNVMLIYY